jgi:collagenase-like PrtC family protease
MKFAVGYQLAEYNEELFTDIIKPFLKDISEVYFPWLDLPSGRSALSNRGGHVYWKAQGILEKELKYIRGKGIKLDLLFNANCYGRYSISQCLENNVCSILEHLQESIGGVDIVTTTSPMIAHVVKTHFTNIEVRASINMRIGEIKGMQYVSHLFDSFYIQREFNRDFKKIEELKTWAENNDKKLFMLANSGCMNYCSGQTFHDNMVSHEAEICETNNIDGFSPYMCWHYLKDNKNWVSVLQNSWIRPEDINNYEGYFDTIKLATRMHSLPGMVIQAYTKGNYFGNLLDLFEPGFGPAFAPYVIDNKKFPEDWFKVTSTCKKNCHECTYCSNVLKNVLVHAGDF